MDTSHFLMGQIDGKVSDDSLKIRTDRFSTNFSEAHFSYRSTGALFLVRSFEKTNVGLDSRLFFDYNFHCCRSLRAFFDKCRFPPNIWAFQSLICRCFRTMGQGVTQSGFDAWCLLKYVEAEMYWAVLFENCWQFSKTISVQKMSFPGGLIPREM